MSPHRISSIMGIVLKLLTMKPSAWTYRKRSALVYWNKFLQELLARFIHW
jgi:hypothetical protein